MIRRASRHPILVLSVAVLLMVVVGLRISTVRSERVCADQYPPQSVVVVDGIELHYVAAGQGDPVVLLHGDGGSALDITTSPVFARLAEHFWVIAMDRPGHGYSDGGEQATTLHGQAGLIHGALQALGVQRPVLVGHSRGASVVAVYLDEYPDQVAAAVSVGGDLWGEPDPDDYGVYRPGAWPLVGPLLVGLGYAPATRFDDYRLLRAGLDQAFAPEGPAPDRYVKAYACQWVTPSNIRTTYRLMQDTDETMPSIRARYPGLEVTVVIVHGDDDGNVAVSRARQAHQLLARSELRVLEGAGHMPHFTRPDDVVDAIHDAASDRLLDRSG